VIGRNVVIELLLGLVLGALVGWIGYRRASLTVSGMISTLVVSALTFALGGWMWGVLILTLFAATELWTRYRRVRQERAGVLLGPKVPRSWDQVLARTGWAIVLLLFYSLAARVTGIYLAFVGAIATANADTWATELGLLSAQAPRLITTRRRVLAGTPGGISILGSVAALAGAWLIGFVGLVLVVIAAGVNRQPWERAWLWLPLSATVGGMLGCLVDSLLGAAAQGIYYCERCQQTTEDRIHTCGETARQVRGWAWLTHNGVDLVSSVVGAATTAGLLAWLAQTVIWW
jgi:uncharacterized protein (TIGR00297 family)